MASNPKLRTGSSSAQAARFGLSGGRRSPFAIAALLALAATAVFAASQLARQGSKTPTSAPRFLATVLGPRQTDAQLRRSLPHGWSAGVEKSEGFGASKRGSRLTLAVAGAGGGSWNGFRHGVSRQTPFGLQTVTTFPGTTEEFLTVSKRQGAKTWHWGLGLSRELKLTTSHDGRVFAGTSAEPQRFQILPVKILDAKGHDVTPAGARWQIAKSAGRQELTLKLDDSKLSLPYVIDPTISFDVASQANVVGATSLTWSHTVGTTLGSRMLVVGVGAENATTTACTPSVAVTYNAVAMTLIDQQVSSTGPSYNCSSLWMMKNPPTGAHNVVATFANAVDIVGGGVSLYQVSQNSAPDASGKATGIANANSVVNLTTLWPNTWVVDHVESGQNLTQALTAAAGQTSRWTRASNSSSGGMSTKLVASAAATTMTWSQTGINRSTSVAAAFSPLDTSAPTQTLTLTESSTLTAINGTTLYYNAQGANAGSFDVGDAAVDTDSGIANVAFPAVTGMTGGGTDAVSPYSTTYNWTAATAATGAQTVVATNGQALTGNSTFTLVKDITAPAGGAMSANGTAASAGGTTSINTTGVISLTKTDYTETQGAAAAGLQSSSLTRAFATFSNNTCGTFGAPVAATITGGNDTAGPFTVGCYQYVLTGKDNVDNTVTLTTTVKVYGAASKVVVTSATGNLTSGTARTLTAELRDANDNLRTMDSTVVTFAKTAGVGTVTGLTTATAAAGIASLPVTAVLAGSITITASAGALTAGTTTFTIDPGAATHVTVTSSAANLTSGAARTLTAEVRDAAQNVVTTDNTTSVTFAKTAGVGTVTGTGAATAAAGIASKAVTAVLAGSITVTASAAGLTSGTITFTIDPGAADHLTFTSVTTNLTSGAARTLTAEVRDAAQNVITTDNTTSVTFAKTAGVGTVTGTGAATAAAGIASKAVTAVQSGSITITASAAGLTSGTTTFTIDPGAADHLTVTSATANLASGAARTLTAEVRDAAQNVVTTDNTTSVTFAKTAGVGTVTGTGAATASAGVASKPVTAVLAGSITITASAAGLTSGTTTFTIDPGAADHLTFTSATTNLTSGSARTLTAEVRDAAQNVLTADNSTSVTFAKTAGTGTVTGLGAATASAGVASKAVTGAVAGSITITATSGVLTASTSIFTVVVGPADHVTVTSATTNLTSGATRTLTAEIRDAADNLLSADNSTSVTFAKTSGVGTVTGLGAATAASGIASKVATGALAGSITITASAAGLTSGTTTFTIVAGAADHLTFTSSTANLTSGGARTLTAEVRDAANNVLIGDNATSVTFAKTAGLGTVTGLGAATASAGIASKAVTASVAGSITITASAAGLTSGTTTFTIDPGAADHLTVTSSAANLTSGAARTLTAEVRDAANNVITTDNTTSVTFAKTAGAGTVTGLGAATASSGVASKPVTAVLAGSITVTASAAGLTSGTTTFTIDPGAATHITVTSSTANLASNAGRTLTAEVRDANENVLTADNSSSVTFAKTAGAGTATGLGAVTASAGVASKAITAVVAGSITITASSGALTSGTTTFTIDPGAADHLTVTSSTANLSSGNARTLTAEVRDVNNNVLTADNATSVTFAKTAGAGTVTGAGAATAASGIASKAVTAAVAGSITITASAAGLTSGTTTFTIDPGAADHLTVTSATTNLSSGNARTLTAEVRDAAQNVITTDNSTSVTFATTAGTGTVTGAGAATAASGIASKAVTAAVAGSITITASAAGLGSGTTTFTIDPGAADHLTVTSSTANLASGAARTLTAEVRDAANNLLTGDNATSVTFAKTAGVGTVTGLGAATAASGVASKVATGAVAGSITITASAGVLTSGTTTFTIDPGAADHLTFTSSTTNLASGAARTLTAEVRDAAGNVLTGDNSTSVTFAKTSGTGTVTGLGAATASSGVASKVATGALAGSITITASAAGLTSGTTTFTIDPGAADHLTFTSATTNLASGCFPDADRRGPRRGRQRPHRRQRHLGHLRQDQRHGHRHRPRRRDRRLGRRLQGRHRRARRLDHDHRHRDRPHRRHDHLQRRRRSGRSPDVSRARPRISPRARRGR